MKPKIIKAFLTVISLLLVSEIFFLVSLSLVSAQYEQITDDLASEYQLSKRTTELVNSFYDLIQYSNDQERQAIFRNNLEGLNALLAKLDKNLSNNDSWTSYVGAKNTINAVIGEVNKGIDNISAENFSEVTASYLKAANYNNFVRENTGSLVLKELEGAEKPLSEIATMKLWSEIIGVLLLLAAVCGGLLFSFSFSNKLIKPWRRLGEVSKKIEAGNYEEKIDEDLRTGNDELAVLSNSLNAIANSLKGDAKTMKEKDVRLAQTQKILDERELHADTFNKDSEPKVGFL